MRKVARGAALALSLFVMFGTTTASAAVIGYEYLGGVQSCFVAPPCGDEFSVGDDVTGSMLVDMDAVASGSFNHDDILDYAFQIGSLTIDSGNSIVAAGTVGTSGNNIVGGNLILESNGLRLTFNLGSSIWALFDVSGDDPEILAGGNGKFGPGVVVPLPAGIALFAPALFALGLLRRKA